MHNDLADENEELYQKIKQSNNAQNNCVDATEIEGDKGSSDDSATCQVKNQIELDDESLDYLDINDSMTEGLKSNENIKS